MEEFYVISFDTETTGLSIYTSEVIQIGFVIHLWVVQEKKITSTTCIGSFCEFVKCLSKEEFDPRVIEVTKIKRSMVENAKGFKGVVEAMINYIDKVCTSSEIPRVLMTYNGDAYDIPVMIAELMRHVPNPMESIKKMKITYNMDILACARKCADPSKLKRNKLGRPSYRLGDLYEAFMGETMTSAHNALGDAIGVLKCVENICDITDAIINDLTSTSTSWKYARNISELAKLCITRYSSHTLSKEKKSFSLMDIIATRKRKLKE